jgi:hypothetical protein
MLSAIKTASYQSSLEMTYESPRDEEEIRKDIDSVEGQIRGLMSILDNWLKEDIQSINIDYLFHDFDLIKLQLPGLMDDLDTYEEELKRAYLAMPDCMAIAKEDF